MRNNAIDCSSGARMVIFKEFCHRRMMQEAQSRGLSGSNSAKALSHNPSMVRQLTQYPLEVEDLLAGELTILPIESDDIAKGVILQRAHGLLTNDSLHLAAAIRAGLRLMATADSQFSAVPDFTIFQPDDIRS